MKKVIVITGPTGVGKTDISLSLCQAFHGEIINADASQFVKELSIGTAKLSLAEQLNIPHHLIDFLHVGESFSIKDFQTLGRQTMDKITLPFVVGGSGLYIQALVSDYQLTGPKRNDDAFATFSNEALHQLLVDIDKEAAQIIHPNNRRRIIRYLERFDEGPLVANTIPNNIYDVLMLCFVRPRDVLYQRINSRCEQMFANGWVEECRQLTNAGINVSDLKEIGYREINAYLQNETSLEEVKEKIKQKTRQYAKRQMTWFRNKMHCQFIDLETVTLPMIMDTVTRFLTNKQDY